MAAAGLSWQVRLASTLVGLGVVVGVGMIILAFALMRGDPGFLFAVLPVVFLVLSVAGVSIATFSMAMMIQLRRAAPGARLQVGLFGGCLVVSGFFVATGSAWAAVFLVVYGATLVWLMTTPAAANDLGAWIAPVARGPWFARAPWRTEHPRSGVLPTAAPRPWWETWQAGLAQGMPRWEMVLVVVGLLAFAVGVVALPLGLTMFPAIRPLAMLLIALAVAVVWAVEQRMKGRLRRR
jgi:hypothetical protein